MDHMLYAPLVIALVPLVIAGLKMLIPAKSWVWPVLATLLGAATDVVTTAAAGGTFATPWAGAALGLAGIGLRELVDQLKRAAVDAPR